MQQCTDTELRIAVADQEARKQLFTGASVAIDGTCLTVTDDTDGVLSFTFMPETAAKTIIGTYQPGSKVNIEWSLRYGDSMDGHLVQGHVDGIATVKDIVSKGNAYHIWITLDHDPGFLWAVPKGAIAMNGISLTIIDCEAQTFEVGIIPHTWEVTNVHRLQPGSKVNIEFDITGKYVSRLVEPYVGSV